MDEQATVPLAITIPSPLTTISPPNYVAYWTFGGGNVRYQTTWYPCWWFRFWQRWILGIRWHKEGSC